MAQPHAQPSHRPADQQAGRAPASSRRLAVSVHYCTRQDPFVKSFPRTSGYGPPRPPEESALLTPVSLLVRLCTKRFSPAGCCSCSLSAVKHLRRAVGPARNLH